MVKSTFLSKLKPAVQGTVLVGSIFYVGLVVFNFQAFGLWKDESENLLQ